MADYIPAPDAEFDSWLDYQMTQGGLTVYYQACWVGTCDDTGPWGELVSATVVK